VSIVKKDGSYCKMQDGTELPISRRKYDNLIKYISIG
jgi:DNA-binding LytR/AlgR family response regulator